MTREEFNSLYEKYISGKCSYQEQKALENYQESFDLADQEWDHKRMGDPDSARKAIRDNLNQSIQNYKKSRAIRTRIWYAAASVVLIMLSAGLYLNFQNDNHPVENPVSQRFKNDILPGNNMAVLTLDDGSRINLDDAKNGILVKENNIDIKKINAGQLEYSASGNQAANAVKYNSLSTPMGGQYQLILPDGSKVWLNSGSSLRFPTEFIGSERIVELIGEAYFEIAENKLMPFKVRTNNMDVKVIGTHFNIMAYDNENNVNTTLLEGSVQILKGDNKVFIKPGQSAILNKRNDAINIAQADLEQAIAWKNGYFIFIDENIESIMRKVSRWYNIDVIYQGNLSNKDFVGTISRNKNISELLKMLELTGAVHFSIEGRRVTVMP